MIPTSLAKGYNIRLESKGSLIQIRHVALVFIHNIEIIYVEKEMRTWSFSSLFTR